MRTLIGLLTIGTRCPPRKASMSHPRRPGRNARRLEKGQSGHPRGSPQRGREHQLRNAVLQLRGRGRGRATPLLFRAPAGELGALPSTQGPRPPRGSDRQVQEHEVSTLFPARSADSDPAHQEARAGRRPQTSGRDYKVAAETDAIRARERGCAYCWPGLRCADLELGGWLGGVCPAIPQFGGKRAAGAFGWARIAIACVRLTGKFWPIVPDGPRNEALVQPAIQPHSLWGGKALGLRFSQRIVRG